MSAAESTSTSVVSNPADLDTDTVLVLPVFESDDASTLHAETAFEVDTLSDAFKRGEVRSRKYESALLRGRDGRTTLFVGSGARSEVEPIIALRLAAAASRYLLRRGYDRIAYLHRGILEPRSWAQAVTQGALQGPYDPGLKKSRERTERRLRHIGLVSDGSQQDLEVGSRLGITVGESIEIARDLVNLPPNELTPTRFAELARQHAEEASLSCDVLDEAAMRELGMGSFLGVSQGSYEPAQLIVLRYGPADAAVKLAVVGKGLTFDSGGLSLKTHEGMETMKGDMGGGAAVLAGMLAIARLRPSNISVTGYIGATENMPSGRSMRPGDVLTAMNGTTIEVLNTDAEGRLVLADVLAYAVSQGATHIVDFATLTGGAVVALGHDVTLATGRPSQWVEEAVDAAAAGLERAWPMPLYDEYRRAMDSDVADLKNTGGRYGSALTAAAFLSDFVNDVPWAHMDIAGTAWSDKATPFRPVGGTGAGVGTIAALALRLASAT